MGARYMDFPGQVLKMKKHEFKEDQWMLVGPRSAPFCCLAVARQQKGLVDRSVTWKHENRVEEDSHIGQMHECCSEALELAACVDQLDLFNCAFAESLWRQMQFLEHEVKKKREAKSTPDASHFFRARPKMTGGAIIDPH